MFVMTRVPAFPPGAGGVCCGSFLRLRAPIVSGCGGDAAAQALEEDDSEKVSVGLW